MLDLVRKNIPSIEIFSSKWMIMFNFRREIFNLQKVDIQNSINAKNGGLPYEDRSSFGKE